MKHALFAWLLLCGLVHAEIQVPPSVEPYRVIAATVTAAVPDGARFDGGWEVSEGVSYLPHAERTIHLTAKPGQHQLKYAGFWIHTKSVEVTGADGKPITIESYIGHGRIDESASFTVPGGAEPDPPKPTPDPEPVVSQGFDIVFFHKAELLRQKPRAQQYLLASREFRDKLKQDGHTFLQAIDDGQMRVSPSSTWHPWVNATKGKALPVMVIRGKKDKKYREYSLPSDYESLIAILEQAK